MTPAAGMLSAREMGVGGGGAVGPEELEPPPPPPPHAVARTAADKASGR